MHIAYTYRTLGIAACTALIACCSLLMVSSAHAQVTEEEGEVLQAQLSAVQEFVDALQEHKGKVLGLSTVAVSGTSYSSSSFDSILKQIESLKSRVYSLDSNSGSSSSGSGRSYYSGDKNTGSSSPWGHNVSTASRKAALQKQIDQIDDRIEDLTAQKAKLQAELDKLNASSTSSTNPKNSTGIVLSAESDSAEEEDGKGVYTMEFEVKAKDQDVYINEDAVRAAAFDKTAGVNFVIKKKSDSLSHNRYALTVVDLSQNVATAGTVSATLTSDAEQSGDYYIVEEGETETFTLEVTYTPADDGSYQMQLVSVNWNTSATDAAKRTTPRSLKDFTTDLVELED